MAHPALTPDQLAAIVAYAAYHGRAWKMALRGDWLTSQTSGHLQTLRNTHGPSWLTSFKLPK
jgi:hypothetical protein